ncbi:MAG: adenine phosphoribosyltransferase [Prolixibacteraceae bacterium]|nr:adenine phosphoribosyltransferase [Prolixibacteraceae bacterium]
MDFKSYIRVIPDFPTEGISFKDITTLLKERTIFNALLNDIFKKFEGKGITKVIGIEARGFILGGAVANMLNAGFVPARKKGKLPAGKLSESYDLEYGTDTIEMHSDALTKDDVVLIHDDLLATGGTALAVLNLVNTVGVKRVYFNFVCDLEFIKTEAKDIIDTYKPYIVIKFQE